MRNLLLVLVALTFCSCAFVDQKIALTYDPSVNATGGSGELFVSKAVEMQSLSQKSGGLWIIGTVKNTYGMRTADVVTDNNIGDWVVGAFSQELRTAGYDVKPVTQLPTGVTKGMDVTILRVFVDQDSGFFSVGAISDLQFNVDIWKNGVKVKTINIAAKGDDRSMIGGAETKALSLKKALQAAMQQSIPEVITTLER